MTEKTAVLFAGTNDWDNESEAHQGVLAAIRALQNKSYTVVLVLPNKIVNKRNDAYNGALAAATEASIATEYPTGWDTQVSYHISLAAAKVIRAKYPGAYYTGDSNSIRAGATEGISGFTGKGAEFIAEQITISAPQAEVT